MSAATTRALPPAAASSAAVNPWLIAVLVAFASFMDNLDSAVTNVALPYIAGGLGVSEDEASWVVTTYLVANAVSLTASSYLAQRCGRKTFLLTCLALFSATSVLSGLAPNLQALLLFRVLQGIAGGGMVPASQAILADSFPPEKRGQAFGLFGIAVAVAPVVGPTLGGWLSDNWSWHWCFEINGPIGLLALVLLAVTLRESEVAERKRLERRGSGFDLVGFALVATFLGALEIALARGLEDDWFGSNFIVGVVAVCVLALILMIPWELSRRNPAVDVRIVATRQFGACFLVMLAIGAILRSTPQIYPQLVQAEYGYTATWAGLVLFPGGLVTALLMPVVGRLSTKIQPRTLIATGALVCALAMFDMTRITVVLDFQFFAISQMLLGVGLPLIVVPILTASFDGIPHNKTDMASALINMASKTGGSIGISFANNVLGLREQFHQSRLVELVNVSTVQFQAALKQATDYFVAQGSSLAQAHQQAFIWIAQQVQTQATFLAYIDVFWALTLVSAAAVPLALTLRKVKTARDNKWSSTK